MIYVVIGLITIAALALQYFLSKRVYGIFGGILPLAILVISIWLYASEKLAFSSESVIPFAILFVLFLGIWINERTAFKKGHPQDAEPTDMKDDS